MKWLMRSYWIRNAWLKKRQEKRKFVFWILNVIRTGTEPASVFVPISFPILSTV